MNPIFNTKTMFYDYFPHINPMRMKTDFDLGFFEQSVIRNEIQKTIRQAYDRLVASHDLMHVEVYQEIGDEFDQHFYDELKSAVRNHFRAMRSWEFLDKLMLKKVVDDEKESANFNSRMLATLGYGLKKNPDGAIDLKEALVALLNGDLDCLNGRELLYLTKIK